MTGTVGLRLYKGNVNVTHRKSPYSLYRKDLASFHHDALQPQGRRRLHQSFRFAGHDPASKRSKS